MKWKILFVEHILIYSVLMINLSAAFTKLTCSSSQRGLTSPAALFRRRLTYRTSQQFRKRRPARQNEEIIDAVKDRPFTLPSGEFRPKQSLGQNFLSDQNYVRKICDSFTNKSERGSRVVEIGPGAGALTRVLYNTYPAMTAIEIDQRAVKFLGEKLPGLQVIHQNVLEFDWAAHAAEKGGKLGVIANLPYHVVSQVLFSLADCYRAVDKAVVTMQLEVAERVCARPHTKDYGIPSVALQLYATPKLLFHIPPSVFYPQPKVDSALISLDFRQPHPKLHTVRGSDLRKVVTTAFGQRRKMLRQSLKPILDSQGIVLSSPWSTSRPEDITPEGFIDLTAELFGTRDPSESRRLVSRDEGSVELDPRDRDTYVSEQIWRNATVCLEATI